MEKVDLYNRKNKLDALVISIKSNRKISARNKTILLDFHNSCFADSLSVGRIQKLLNVMSKVAQWMKKDLEKANRDDIMQIVQIVEKQPFADWTKYDYKVVIKKFYKWLRKTEDTYPDEVRWIKPRIKNGNHKLPEELLTEDEIKKMVDAAEHIRDKALIFILYESGCRIGEIASMKIKHVQFDKYGAVAMVTGKTGDRRVRLISSAPLLSNWIANHPLRDDPDSPLWVGIGARSKNDMICYNTMSMMIKDAAKRAGIKKKVYPHLFRHSRATHLAKFLTEAQMKQIFGWTQSSDMAAVYVHLSGRDTDDAILELNGIKTDMNEKKESALKPKKCPRCDTVNPATAMFCQRCSFTLNVIAAMKVDDERSRIDEVMAKLMNDPKMQRMIEKRLG
jgi:integrase/ribosomal protein L40E